MSASLRMTEEEHAQSTNSVLMIRPGRFYPNPETAADNAFQRNADRDSDALTLAGEKGIRRGCADAARGRGKRACL